MVAIKHAKKRPQAGVSACSHAGVAAPCWGTTRAARREFFRQNFPNPAPGRGSAKGTDANGAIRPYVEPVQAGAAGVPVQFFLKAQPHGNPLGLYGFAKARTFGQKYVGRNSCRQNAWVEKKQVGCVTAKRRAWLVHRACTRTRRLLKCR